MKEEHLRVQVEQDGIVRDVVAFRQASSVEMFTGPVDIAYVLEENVWGGQKTLQLRAKAIRPAEED